jgi:hypothetical protein
MPPRVLIAIVSCHAYRARADAQRATWVSDVQGADVRVFLGGGLAERTDEVILDVGDGYGQLPAKTQSLCRWALEQGYDHVLKCDDDAYVRPERLLASGFEQHDYTGRVRGPSGIFPAPYCSGFSYWLSAQAMRVVADAPHNGDEAEDRFVANTLLEHGIHPFHDCRYAVVSSGRNARSFTEPPLPGNSVISACEFEPATLIEVHRAFVEERSKHVARCLPSGPLDRVCLMVKTFLRDGLLFRCIDGVERNLPEVKMVIVDDGREWPTKITLYASLRDRGHECVWLPFDSGFGAKANAALPYCDREFVLIGSDDFDFSYPDVRAGILKMQAVLDGDPSVHIVSGRVDGLPYESLLEIDGSTVREIPGHRETRSVNGVTYKTCDLTVNFSLIRRACLGPHALHWDGEDAKIGCGEHGSLYFDAKNLGYGVSVIEDVSIREMGWDFSLVHPEYPQFRNRARLPARPCFKARGIERWYLQDGTCEVTP